MFGLEFLFSAALWALPLAGLPLILHLLFRRKSPVIDFSTLRFIKASLQRTAARRRVHKWLLLAMRVLLIGLLIWAIAQPAKMLASSWFGSQSGTIAAIVIDNSYSMQLKPVDATLLQKADHAIGQLLRHELSSASVAIYPSADDPQMHKLRSASEVLSQWRPLTPQAAQRPLIDRIEQAAAMLQAQPASDRLLFIISDLQAREFSRPIATKKDLRLIMLDLHPDEARSAGIVDLRLEPAEPIPGIESKVVVEVAGRKESSRAVTLAIKSVDGKLIDETAPKLIHLDASGRGQADFSLSLPADQYVWVTARLQGEDAMPWDDTRSRLVGVPLQGTVALLNLGASASSERYVSLALDPNEGALANWPLKVKQIQHLTGNESAIVALLSQWPDEPTTSALQQVAGRGGVVLLMLQPGLEGTWAALPEPQRDALTKLMGAAPQQLSGPSARYQVNVATATSSGSTIFAGLSDGTTPLTPIQVQRLVPLVRNDAASRVVLSAEPASTVGQSRPQPWLVEHKAGQGRVYTLASLPDRGFTDLPLHPAFVPMLVRITLAAAASSPVQNIALGQMLLVRPNSPQQQIELQLPDGGRQLVPPSDGNIYTFGPVHELGEYRWFAQSDKPSSPDDNGKLIAVGNVQPPSTESVLDYRPADQIVPADDSTLIVRSYDELQQHLSKMTQPQPKWTIPIAIVLVLLCAEAAVGAGFRAR